MNRKSKIINKLIKNRISNKKCGNSRTRTKLSVLRWKSKRTKTISLISKRSSLSSKFNSHGNHPSPFPKGKTNTLSTSIPKSKSKIITYSPEWWKFRPNPSLKPSITYPWRFRRINRHFLNWRKENENSLSIKSIRKTWKYCPKFKALTRIMARLCGKQNGKKTWSTRTTFPERSLCLITWNWQKKCNSCKKAEFPGREQPTLDAEKADIECIFHMNW